MNLSLEPLARDDDDDDDDLTKQNFASCKLWAQFLILLGTEIVSN